MNEEVRIIAEWHFGVIAWVLVTLAVGIVAFAIMDILRGGKR